jgi:hypothetical protein
MSEIDVLDVLNSMLETERAFNTDAPANVHGFR